MTSIDPVSEHYFDLKKQNYTTWVELADFMDMMGLTIRLMRGELMRSLDDGEYDDEPDPSSVVRR